MNLKVGDVVSVIDDTLEGEIQEINGDHLFIVDQNGFVFKYKVNQVVKITDYLPVNDRQIEKIIKDKETKPYSYSLKKNKSDKPIQELDLHIHELTESTRNMSDFDMLNLQLRTAERRIQKAIENKEKKLILIHGIGKGRLKSELEIILQRYSQIEYYDADYQKYGRGATEIYIYENVV